jgi:hypothetical protein
VSTNRGLLVAAAESVMLPRLAGELALPALAPTAVRLLFALTDHALVLFRSLATNACVSARCVVACSSSGRGGARRSRTLPVVTRESQGTAPPMAAPLLAKPPHGQSAQRFAEGYGASRSHIHASSPALTRGSEGIGLARPWFSSTRKLHNRLHIHRTRLNLQVDANTKTPTCGAFAEPSDGLEPSTPSLPFACAPPISRQRRKLPAGRSPESTTTVGSGRVTRCSG